MLPCLKYIYIQHWFSRNTFLAGYNIVLQLLVIGFLSVILLLHFLWLVPDDTSHKGKSKCQKTDAKLPILRYTFLYQFFFNYPTTTRILSKGSGLIKINKSPMLMEKRAPSFFIFYFSLVPTQNVFLFLELSYFRFFLVYLQNQRSRI